MAANSTPNFGLNQWQADDPVLREDFNSDNQKLEQALSMLGNCCIASGSYVGTGEYGEGTSCHLDFGFKPMVLILDTANSEGYTQHSIWFNNGVAPIHPNSSYVIYHVTWGETDITWYMTCIANAYNNAASQFNTAGKTYRYTVLGYKA